MESYLAQRAALIAEAEPGLGAARELSAITDEAVRRLARTASERSAERWAIVALGGWGAGALLPSSDLDVLVLSEAPAHRLKPFVEALLYPLWDAGLKVGHQVRTPREHLRAMRSDLASCTAALTGRALCGDVEWGCRTLAAGAADARKRSKRLLRELAERPRPGTPYALEPDLKEGAGGRRDFDELVWSAAILTGSVQCGPHELGPLGLALAEELAEVEYAAGVVASARFELARAGLGTVMTLDAAEMLSVTNADTVQTALAQTALILGRIRRRISGAHVERDDPLSPEAAFALFEGGDHALQAVEEAAQAGRLDSLTPGFSALMTVRRPGIGHELTVGAHSLRTVATLVDLPGDMLLERSRAALEHPRALQVAALTHDVGKTQPGPGHPERGAGTAEETARRFGLTEPEASDVRDLVRLHLALADTATRIDLDDEDAILSAAARIGRRELLAPLHLLTAADSLATGPATWSRWTASLVAALVSRLDAALSDEVDGAGIASRGEAVRAATLSAMAEPNPAERAFVQGASLRYLASREPAEVARDAKMVAALSLAPTAEEARIAIGSGPTPDTHSVTVAARDRAELLARTAGAMSLAGLDILALDAYGVSEGVALDTFIVASATRKPVTTETFTTLERLLRAALRDRLELQTRLAERRKHYPARASAPLSVEMVSAGWDTAVRVSAPDRPGLLHDLARAVSSSGLDIRWAKVITVGGMALDTFHVVGPDGGPVDDPGMLGHLAMRLREIH